MCSALISNMTWLGCYTYQQAPREPNGARFVKTRGVFVDIKPTEETLKSPTVTKHKTWGAGPCIKTWGAPLLLDGKVAGAQREYSNRGEVRTREPSLSFTTNVIYTQPAHNPIAIIKGSRCARKGDLEHKHKDIYDIHAGINKS